MRSRVFVSLVVVAVILFSLPVSNGFAASRASDLLKEGLLGAGAGAVGGAASGAKGGDVWKGALAGAGVNIIGGALLDSMSGDNQSAPAAAPARQQETGGAQSAYSDGYQDGYSNGYKKGYTDGYKEGLKEAYKSE